MITTLMAGFAFGYCVTDLIMNFYNKTQYDKILRETVEIGIKK